MAEPKITYNLQYAEKFDVEDFDERRLILNSEVDESIITTIAYHILRYNRLDKGVPVEERKPILLYLNSPGGTVSDGWGLIDAITTSKTPVYTINQGMCASMAFIIFISGHKRYSMEHSEFLMHDGSTGLLFESTAKCKDRIDFEAGQLEEVAKEFIVSHTKIDEDKYDMMYRKEWYFLPIEGKECGVVDFIVGKDCDIDEII